MLSRLKKYKFIYKFSPLIISLLFTIPSLLGIHYVELSYQNTENELLQKETRFASFELAENFKRNITQKINILQILAQGHPEIFGKDKKFFDTTSKAIVQNIPTFFAVSWTNPEGRITWVYPEEPNKAALGKMVLLRDAERKYLIDSRDSHEPQISHIIDLYQGLKGIILYVPTYNNGQFNGWVVGVIDLQASFDKFFERRKLENFHASLKWKDHEKNVYNYGKSSSHAAEIKFESQILNQNIIVEVDLQRGEQLETRKDRLNRVFFLLYISIILIGIFLYYVIKSQLKVTELYGALKRDKTLINILSHDMATPLTIISENIKRLKEKLKDQSFAEVDRIIRSSDRQKDLLSRVRSFHATSMRKKRMELIPVLCVDLVQDAIALCEDQFKAKGITYKTIAPPKFMYCLADRMTAVHNVLGNVLSNAIKFSKGGSTITIRLFEEGNYVVIEIADQGTGIPKDILDHLFDESSITSTAGTQGEVGTGLGMLQIKAFMEFYKGDVKISTSEKGTTVQLFFRSTEI